MDRAAPQGKSSPAAGEGAEIPDLLQIGLALKQLGRSSARIGLPAKEQWVHLESLHYIAAIQPRAYGEENMQRRSLLAALLGGSAMMMAAPAGAAIEAKFDAAAFAAAQAAGKPILVAVHADWCPVCTKQKPILSRLGADPAMKDLMVFVVDFDTQKDVVRRFGAQMQSTLIVFRGSVERDRSVGVTDEAALKALLGKAVA